jgi:hypothetical protein
MQQIDNRRATAKDEFETFQADAASSQKRSLQLQSQLIQKKESLTELEMSLRLLEENQRSLLGIPQSFMFQTFSTLFICTYTNS